MYVPDCTGYILSMYYVCTCSYLFSLSEPLFTGFRGVPQHDANMPVPDAQQPPADLDIDRDDPCPEDEELFCTKAASAQRLVVDTLL